MLHCILSHVMGDVNVNKIYILLQLLTHSNHTCQMNTQVRRQFENLGLNML